MTFCISSLCAVRFLSNLRTFTPHHNTTATHEAIASALSDDPLPPTSHRPL